MPVRAMEAINFYETEMQEMWERAEIANILGVGSWNL